MFAGNFLLGVVVEHGLSGGIITPAGFPHRSGTRFSVFLSPVVLLRPVRALLSSRSLSSVYLTASWKWNVAAIGIGHDHVCAQQDYIMHAKTSKSTPVTFLGRA